MKTFPIKFNPKIHPGTTFWGFVFIAGFLLFSRWLFDEAFFLNSLYVIVIYATMAFLYTSFVLDKVSIVRKSRYHRRQVGDLYEEDLLITNHSLLPIFWMQIRDCSALNRNHSNRVIGYLGRHQTRNIGMSSFLQKRGNITLSPVEVTTSDPLGCYFAVHNLKTEGSLIVLPYQVDLSSILIKNRQSEEGRSARLTLYQNSMISGSVRNYIDGDAFNRIHWPTTARKGSLHTKLPDVSIQQIVWICMDCQRKAHASRLISAEQERMDFLDAANLHLKYALPPDTAETTVSITSSLAVTWLKRGIAVGMAMNQQPNLTIMPGFGIRQQAEILNTLTYVQANSRIPFASMLTEFSSQLQPGNICFLVTPEDSMELIQAAHLIQQKGVDLRVIHVNRESYLTEHPKKKYIKDWKAIRSIHFNYGDPLAGLIPIL